MLREQSHVYKQSFDRDIAAMKQIGNVRNLLLPSPVEGSDTHIMVWKRNGAGDRLRQRVWKAFDAIGHALRDQVVLPVVLQMNPDLRQDAIVMNMQSYGLLPWPSRAKLVHSGAYVRGTPRHWPTSPPASSFRVEPLPARRPEDCFESFKLLEQASGPGTKWSRRVELPRAPSSEHWTTVELRSPRALTLSAGQRARVWIGDRALELIAPADRAVVCSGPFPDALLVQAIDAAATVLWMTDQP